MEISCLTTLGNFKQEFLIGMQIGVMFVICVMTEMWNKQKRPILQISRLTANLVGKLRSSSSLQGYGAMYSSRHDRRRAAANSRDHQAWTTALSNSIT